MDLLKQTIPMVVLAIGLVFAVQNVNVSLEGVSDGLGGVPGVSLYPQSVTTFTEGGGYTSISTSSATYTLSATQMDTENYISFTPTGAAATLTLPATSTLSNFVPNAGDTRRIMIENAATAATTTTIAAGTGMDLQEPDGQNVVIGQNNYAWLTFVRQSSGDIVVRVDETIPAD